MKIAGGEISLQWGNFCDTILRIFFFTYLLFYLSSLNWIQMYAEGEKSLLCHLAGPVYQRLIVSEQDRNVTTSLNCKLVRCYQLSPFPLLSPCYHLYIPSHPSNILWTCKTIYKLQNLLKMPILLCKQYVHFLMIDLY